MEHVKYYSNPDSAEKFSNTKGNGYQIVQLNDVLNYCADNAISISGDGILMTLYREFLESRRDDIIIPLLGQSNRDVATGTSYFYKHLMTDRQWNGDVEGIDISTAMIQINQKELIALESFYNSQQVKQKIHDGLFVWQDHFNRTTFDLRKDDFPVYDSEELRYLRDNLTTIDVLAYEPTTVVETTTGFSGPLCFYDDLAKKKIIENVKHGTSKYLSLQLKNLGSKIVEDDVDLHTSLIEVINHAFQLKPNSIRNFLDESNITDYVYSELNKCDATTSREKIHHNGDFSSYLSGNEKDDLFESQGLNVLERKGFVFLPTHFGSLISSYFQDTKGNPRYISEFAKRFFIIEHYFLDNMPDVAENIHLNCSMTKDAKIKPINTIEKLINSFEIRDIAAEEHNSTDFFNNKLSFKELDAKRNKIRLQTSEKIIYEDVTLFDN